MTFCLIVGASNCHLMRIPLPIDNPTSLRKEGCGGIRRKAGQRSGHGGGRSWEYAGRWGGRGSHLRNLVLQQGMLPVVLGWAAGIMAAMAAGSMLRGLLFGVSAQDPLTLASVTLVVLATALLACYLPARRAMKVDPMVALRYEKPPTQRRAASQTRCAAPCKRRPCRLLGRLCSGCDSGRAPGPGSPRPRAHHQHLLFSHPASLTVLNRNIQLCWNRNFSLCCDTIPDK